MDKLELYDKLEKVLEKDLAPALGCTEPMCFGLCAATARRYAPGEILSITVEATTVMLKGVAYVRIPNSGGHRRRRRRSPPRHTGLVLLQDDMRR